MSLYRGVVKFDREQLIFMAETTLIGALDRIESGLPSCIEWVDRENVLNETDNKPTELSAYDRGALETCGMALGVLCAQLTGDGLGIYDALACAMVNGQGFDEACKCLVSESWKDEGRIIKQRMAGNQTGERYTIESLFGDLWPDTRKHAEAFVDKVFGHYLHVPIDS